MFQSGAYPEPIISRLGNRPSFLRLVRWVAAGLLIALGLTLSATSLSGYRVVRGALDTVVRGQGESLLQVAMRAMQRSTQSDVETLKGVLESESQRGLRCLVLFEYGQEGAAGQPATAQPRAAVGECLTPASAWSELVMPKRQEAPAAVGDRIRMVLGPPQPTRQSPMPTGYLPSYGGPPPAGSPWPAPPAGSAASTGPAWPGPTPQELDAAAPRPTPGPGGPRAPRPMLLEFVPQMAEELRHSAMRTLLSGGIATLALLIAAAVFWRFSLREEQVAATREQKRQLASLGEMAAVLAHELRNPLAALKGHAQLLLEQLPQGSKPRDKAARVVSESERLEALSEDLLSFVRTTVLEPQNINPAEFLNDCVAALGDARIEVSTSSAPATWQLDPQRMRQVLSNLLTNALEASPKDGKVLAHVRREGNELVFSIRDHGKGIPEQDLPRIFEPFFTTRARGTGLGLAIVRRLVSLHGGRISARNADEGGALFSVRLPKELP